MKKMSQSDVRFQLSVMEFMMQGILPDPYYASWKRHYYLKRLLELQLREFSRD